MAFINNVTHDNDTVLVISIYKPYPQSNKSDDLAEPRLCKGFTFDATFIIQVDSPPKIWDPLNPGFRCGYAVVAAVVMRRHRRQVADTSVSHNGALIVTGNLNI